MQCFEYEVDRELNIQSCTGSSCGNLPVLIKQSLGKPYYNVLPRIVDDDNRDIVMDAMVLNKNVVLKDYRFICLFDCVCSEVSITPIVTNGKNVVGASVNIKIKSPCSSGQSSEFIQGFVDIGKAASMLSHGVRNPLNAIKGAVVYLKNRYESEKDLIEFADIMEEEISRLDLFITKFLSSSCVDLNPQKININEVLEKIQRYVSLQARSSNVNIDFRYGEIDPLMVSPFHYEQAVLNVINNAMAAMPQGGNIVVESRPEARKEKKYVVVDVTDDGPGMSASAIRNLDDQQPPRTRTSGKGFGLFIAREALKAHGGLLEIMSEAGKGTKVCLWIPVEQPEG